MSTIRTFYRVITEGRQDSSSPLVKTSIDRMFGSMYCSLKFGIDLSMSCIQSTIANHLKVFLWNVPDETFDEIYGRDSFLHIFFILMAVVMKSDHFIVIFINAGSGYDRTSEITPDIFNYIFGVAFVWFGVNIETEFMIRITFRFYFFKGRSKFGFQFIKKCSAKSITQVRVVKMFYMTPKAIVTVSAFGNQTVNVRVPF